MYSFQRHTLTHTENGGVWHHRHAKRYDWQDKEPPMFQWLHCTVISHVKKITLQLHIEPVLLGFLSYDNMRLTRHFLLSFQLLLIHSVPFLSEVGLTQSRKEPISFHSVLLSFPKEYLHWFCKNQGERLWKLQKKKSEWISITMYHFGSYFQKECTVDATLSGHWLSGTAVYWAILGHANSSAIKSCQLKLVQRFCFIESPETATSHPPWWRHTPCFADTSVMWNIVGVSLRKYIIDWAFSLWSNLQHVMHEFQTQDAAGAEHIVVAMVCNWREGPSHY